jgi:chemotaxis protein histidine kinase CheA
MSSSVGLLDFFILEASDYLERLDGLLADAYDAGPDADAFARYARALRGSATMARLTAMAELAGVIERLGRAVRDGTLPWEPGVHGALTAGVEELKILLRSVRTWGSSEDARAKVRVVELASLLPSAPRPGAVTPVRNIGSAAFLANEAAEIAASLDAYVEQTNDIVAFGHAMRRVRALRGVASIRDLPPLSEVVEAVERAAKPIELGDATPTPQSLSLLFAAAQVLRGIATAIRTGSLPDVSAPEVQRFTAAATLLDAGDVGEAERIVPIGELFFSDAGPHLVSRATNPPTNPTERFRLEVVSQAEHLRRLIADAMQAKSGIARDAAARELRHALRALRSAAESFGERELAQFVGGATDAVTSFEPRAIAALGEIAALLANPAAAHDALVQRLAELSGGVPPLPPGARASAPTARPTGGGASRPFGGGLARSASGSQLRAILADSIAGIARLETHPLSEPTPLDEELVPIESLLYRGAAAMARAKELRAQLATHGGTPSPDQLNELYELLELAAAE